MAMWMAQNAGVLLHSQGEQIRALYGDAGGEGEHGRRASGQAGLGPFSVKTYITHMLQEGSWGDQICLSALSMMLQCRLSLINAEGMYVLDFRHKGSLAQADMVLVYNGETHFMGTGNYISISCR
jgi:hypothetical protein